MIISPAKAQQLQLMTARLKLIAAIVGERRAGISRPLAAFARRIKRLVEEYGARRDELERVACVSLLSVSDNGDVSRKKVMGDGVLHQWDSSMARLRDLAAPLLDPKLLRKGERGAPPKVANYLVRVLRDATVADGKGLVVALSDRDKLSVMRACGISISVDEYSRIVEEQVREESRSRRSRSRRPAGAASRTAGRSRRRPNRISSGG